jgi:tryptophan halogenase
MTNFPDKSFNQPDIDYYNRRTRLEFEQVRDFIILHYKATEREDSPLWRYCREMPVPEALAQKIALFRASGRLFRAQDDLFAESSWLQVLVGQRVMPGGHHALAHLLSEDETAYFLERMRRAIAEAAESMPGHGDYIARHCAAGGR